MVGGKPSSSSSSAPSITNQLEREPKPVLEIVGSGVRTYGGSGASIGGLFANGLPSKPSENKIRRANTTVTPAAAPSPPPPPVPYSGRNFSAPPPPAMKPSDLVFSNKPSPPPPPIQAAKPIVNSSSGGREQFKTMRPVRSETTRVSSGLRRSGSSEDVSRESTPVRAPIARPTVPPPGRPTAPPPPPPTMRFNSNHTTEPPPPPTVPPVTSGLPNSYCALTDLEVLLLWAPG
ncbi:unnamed protein product [Haemonchus placei]|uniref:WH2 domain-containing protein n=1 Tax=Haemonchus placei TaxID=6290 RepID=A0A0N4WXF3_HAEPC|nr:unnamed protein product [Haemonchus placei]